jgi:hypothetical protein
MTGHDIRCNGIGCGNPSRVRCINTISNNLVFHYLMKLGTNDIGSVYLGTNAVQNGLSWVPIRFGVLVVAWMPTIKAVLDYATAQGYTLPSSGQQTLQNQLVVDLKDGGIWS